MIREVSLTARMAATRAVASTFPLTTVPSAIAASVSGRSLIQPAATARRATSSFFVTSTIRTASPSMCVNSGIPSPAIEYLPEGP